MLSGSDLPLGKADSCLEPLSGPCSSCIAHILQVWCIDVLHVTLCSRSNLHYQRGRQVTSQKVWVIDLWSLVFCSTLSLWPCTECALWPNLNSARSLNLHWARSLKPLCVSAWGFWWRGGCWGRWPRCGRCLLRCGADTELRQGQSHKKTQKTCMLSENFSRFRVKSVYFAVRVTADRSHIKTANQLVLGRLLCRKWQPVKKFRTVGARKVRRDFALILQILQKETLFFLLG